MSRMQRVESLHQLRCKTSFALVPLQNQSCQTRMRNYYQFPQIPTDWLTRIPTMQCMMIPHQTKQMCLSNSGQHNRDLVCLNLKQSNLPMQKLNRV